MRAATTRTPPAAAPALAPFSRKSARVSLVPAGIDRHRLDGAWWPRSRDLPGELPALIETLDRSLGHISRITVNRSLWPDVPRKVKVHGRTIHTGWFDAEQDPNVIFALDSSGGRWDLLVVPPSCEAFRSARLMDAAARPRNHRTAGALLAGPEPEGRTATAAGGRAAGEGDGSGPQDPQEERLAADRLTAGETPENVWESEGGMTRTAIRPGNLPGGQPASPPPLPES